MRRSIGVLAGRVHPTAFFAASAVFHYLGPSFAVLLFARIEPIGVAWLRIVTAALVFAAWRRPWRAWRAADASARWTVIAWGLLLAAMNILFYLAIDRIALGTVAAIEFAGVVTVAAVSVRTPRNLAALVLAVAGVAALSRVSLGGSPIGFVFALLNAALFAGYIVIGHRVSRQPSLTGIDGLAAAMTVAALAALPFGIAQALPAFVDPVALAAAVGVGVCSSVIPYVLDQLAMRRISRGAYALLSAILPATAVLIGALVLRQIPTWFDLLGIGLVIAAVLLHRDAAR